MGENIDKEFLDKINAVIEKNMANEQFGVSELADEMNMSRSNLLRKVKKETRLSVSQLINQARMKRAMEFLRSSSMNVSEVSVQVGFNSLSYFIKCFREYYGYPPGEVGKRTGEEKEPSPENLPTDAPSRKRTWLIAAAAVVILVVAAGFYYRSTWTSPAILEKSIVVLPFKNDSNDSSNVYLINGLMETTLNHLQKIKDLKVISRTSAEKYRNTPKSIPEIAKELNASYFVEGSGQKIGDQILLNIQLIEGPTDRHLLSRQYRRETKDIFELQQEIAKSIAEEIKVIVTPDEEKRIEKVLTKNMEAYDLFLKGIELSEKPGPGNLEKSIALFDQAITKDPKFAMAYASATMVFYYLDAFQVEKKYGDQMARYADNAWLNDPTQAECVFAKALYYVHKKEYKQAVPYFEKALEYNPNSMLILNFVTDFYTNYLPNTVKYMEYALKSVQLEATSKDSVTTSYNYLRLGNALMQSAFFDEASAYIDKAERYFPKNAYVGYIRAFILFGKNKDCKQTQVLLEKEFRKDTMRIDILQDIGNVCYQMRDYKNAAHYYRMFLRQRESRKLDVYPNLDLRISTVLAATGDIKKAEELQKKYKHYAENDFTSYKPLLLSAYFMHIGDNTKAIEQLKLFAKEDNYLYWVLLLKDDPDADKIKSDPEFQKVVGEIESRFWNNHKKVKQMLEEKSLI